MARELLTRYTFVSMITYTDKDLKDIIPDFNSKIVVLVFSEKENAGCQRFYSELPDIESGLDVLHIEFVDIDIKKHPHIASQYGIEDTPTFILISEGTPVSRIHGFENASRFNSKIRDYFLSGC